MAAEDFVVLESGDGYCFSVLRHIATSSSTLKAMLDEEGAFQEASQNRVKLNYRGIIVLKLIEYLAFKAQYADTPQSEIRDDFFPRIDPYIALELLTIADYLDT